MIRKLPRKCLFLILIFLVSSNLGCEKQPIPNPETIDPIYQDLISEMQKATAAAATEKATLDGVVKELENLKPRDMMKDKLTKERYNRERNLIKHEQMAIYYQLRAEKRKKIDRESYWKAFQAERPWPDPEELEKYNTQKRLERASRNWADRVPKAKAIPVAAPAAAPSGH